MLLSSELPKGQLARSGADLGIPFRSLPGLKATLSFFCVLEGLIIAQVRTFA